MALTPDQIKQLLALPQKPRGRGRKPKNWVDTSVRDIVTWFKLGHKLMDEKTEELAKCENPNCSDTRETHMVTKVNGSFMCRRCFLDGWLVGVEGQTELVEKDD